MRPSWADGPLEAEQSTVRAWDKAEILREMYRQDEVEQRKEKMRDRKMMRGTKIWKEKRRCRKRGED